MAAVSQSNTALRLASEESFFHQTLCGSFVDLVCSCFLAFRVQKIMAQS